MGTIINIGDFKREREEKAAFTRPTARSSPAFARASLPPQGTTSEILTAIEKKDVATLSKIRAPSLHREIQNYKRYSFNYKLLRAVFEDKLEDVKMILEIAPKDLKINEATYWHYPTSRDVHFLTPGDLIQSTAMAQLLKSHGVSITPYLRSCFKVVPIPD